MICSLMLDLDDALDFPGNTAQALGRPLASYPFMAARATGAVSRYYVVTSYPPIKGVALQNGAHIIDPPLAAAGPNAEAQLQLGFQFIHASVVCLWKGSDAVAWNEPHWPALCFRIAIRSREA